MGDYPTFTEYLEQRDAVRYADSQPPPLDAREFDLGTGASIQNDLEEPGAAGDEGRVETRSLFGALFKNPFKAVNPSRPVLPTNSLLLASPFRRKRRLKSQVVGR
jgi:hypothetical protein